MTNRSNQKQQELLETIRNDQVQRFEDIFKLEMVELARATMKTNMTYLQSKQVAQRGDPNKTLSQDMKKNIDQFELLTEIVKYERLSFLERISQKNLFPITQKDQYTGDNLLHYTIFENKPLFLQKILPLYENEINAKNERGNTPFHYACLKGNLEIVMIFMRKPSKTAGQVKAQPIDLVAENKAGLLPLHLAISRSHYFVVHYLLSQEIVIQHIQTRDLFEIYQCFKLAISSRASQIFFLLIDVFNEQIQQQQGSRKQKSFWERKFIQKRKNSLIEKSHSFKEQDNPPTKDSDSSETLSDMEGDNNEEDNQGQYSLLHYAASGGDVAVFQFILDRCLNLDQQLFDNQSNRTKETPLHWAVSCCNKEIVHIIVFKMREIQDTEKKGESLRFEDFNISTQDDAKAYPELLDLPNKAGHTPFFMAVVRGHLEVAQMLLQDEMSDIDYKDFEDDSPLHWAVVLQQPDTVRFLIDQGADMLSQNQRKNSPLTIACLNANIKIVKLLLELAMNQDEQITMTNQQNRKNMTPLHISCLIGDIQMCVALMQCGAEFIKIDLKRFLPIHYATIKDHTDLIRHFVQNDNIKIFDPIYHCNEHTLLTLAIQNGAYNTVKLLVTEYGADVAEKDKQDYTYLHVAAVSGHVNIFLFFLSKQVSLHSKNSKGETAIELATKHGHQHLIKYLRDKFEASLNTGLTQIP